MAGNLNSDSTIWVIGEATGHNQYGESVEIATLSGAFAQEIEEILETVQEISDAGVAALRDELVASGYLGE